MKYFLNKVTYVFMAFLLLFSISCERDTNGPLPNEGMRDAALAYVTFQPTSDELIDLNDPDAFSLDYTIGTLWEPEFQKIELVVVFNGDYSKQYTVVDNITSVPASGTVMMSDIVSAIDDLSSSSDIVEGNSFHFFCNITLPDGFVAKTWDDIGGNGVMLVGSGLVTALSSVEGVGQPDINIPVPCAFDVNDYLGTQTCVDNWWPGVYPVEVSLDPDYSGDGVGLLIDNLMEDYAGEDGGSVGNIVPIKCEINLKNLKLNVPNQIVFSGNFYGYGDCSMSGTGTVNTCDMKLEINVPGYTVAAGSFGGGTLIIGG